MRTDFENEMLIVGNKSLSNKHESAPHQSAEEQPFTAVSNTSQHNLSAKQNVLNVDDETKHENLDFNPDISRFNVDREDVSDLANDSSNLFGSSLPKKIALPEYKNFEEQNMPEEKSVTGAKMGIVPKIDIVAVKDILNEIPTSPKAEILDLISDKMANDSHPANRKLFINSLHNALSALWSGSTMTEAIEKIKSKSFINGTSTSWSFGDRGTKDLPIEHDDFEKIRLILEKGSQDPESKRQVDQVLERGNLAELNEIFSNVKPVQELAHFLLDLIVESAKRSIGEEHLIAADSAIAESTYNLPPIILNAVKSQILSETFPFSEIVSMPISTTDMTYLISRNIETSLAANKINQLVDQSRLNELFELENGEGDSIELKILDKLKEEMRTQVKGALLSDEKNLSPLLEDVHALKANTRAVSHQLTSLSIPQDGDYNYPHEMNDHIPESSQIEQSTNLKLIASKLINTYENIARIQDTTVDMLLNSALSNLPVHSLPTIIATLDNSTDGTYSTHHVELGNRIQQNFKNEISEVFEDFLEMTKLIQSSNEGQTEIPPISDNITTSDFMNVLVEMAEDQIENIFGGTESHVTKNLICESCSQLSQCKNLASECERFKQRNELRQHNLDKITQFLKSNSIEIKNEIDIIEEMATFMGPISNYVDDLERKQILKYYTLATQNFAHHQDGFDLDQPVIDSQLTPSGLSDETSTSTSSYQNIDAQDVRNSIEKLTLQLKEKTKNHSNLQIFQIRSNELMENVSRDLKLSTGNLIPTSDLIEQIKTAINGKEEQKLKNVENMIKIGHFSNAFRIQARVQIYIFYRKPSD